jgi:hypothetical protein
VPQNLTILVSDVSGNLPISLSYYGGFYYIWTAFGMAGIWMFSNGISLFLPVLIWVRHLIHLSLTCSRMTTRYLHVLPYRPACYDVPATTWVTDCTAVPRATHYDLLACLSLLTRSGMCVTTGAYRQSYIDTCGNTEAGSSVPSVQDGYTEGPHRRPITYTRPLNSPRPRTPPHPCKHTSPGRHHSLLVCSPYIVMSASAYISLSLFPILLMM